MEARVRVWLAEGEQGKAGKQGRQAGREVGRQECSMKEGRRVVILRHKETR